MVKKIMEHTPKRRKLSKSLAAVTALSLSAMTVGAVSPVSTAYAAETDEILSITLDPSDIFSIDTSAIPNMFFGASNGTVDLKDGNYERWIDRIDVPDVFRTFYDNMGEWTDNDGYDDYFIDDSNDDFVYFNVRGGDADGNDVGTFKFACVKIFSASDYSGNAKYISKCIIAAYAAFDRDHPEVFWLNGSIMPINDSSGNYYFPVKCVSSSNVTSGNEYAEMYKNYSVKISEYPTSSAVKAGIKDMKSDVNAIINGMGSEIDTEYEKVKYFDEWLTHHNEYNTLVASGQDGAPNTTWESVSALDGRTGTTGPVCEGYARAMKVLCDQVGIHCVVVDGYTTIPVNTDEGHMWNNIRVDGKWYLADPTWDDPADSSGYSWGAESGYENFNYLLLGSQNSKITKRTVSNTPYRNNVSFTNGPVLSETDYDPESVTEVEVSKISVAAEPTNKTYTVGDTFDPTGLALEVTFSDDSTETVTYTSSTASKFKFSPEVFTAAGEDLTVTVTYEEQETEITGITVNKKSPAASDFVFTQPENCTYDGTEKTATVAPKSDITGMGNITVYYTDSDDNSTTSAPTEKGTYTVKITVDDTGAAYKGTADGEFITDPSWTFEIVGETTDPDPDPTPDPDPDPDPEPTPDPDPINPRPDPDPEPTPDPDPINPRPDPDPDPTPDPEPINPKPDPTPDPDPTPTPTPTPTPDPTPDTGTGSSSSTTGSSQGSSAGPAIIGGNGEKGWLSIVEVINEAPDGTVITIDMNGSTILPKSAVSAIAGRDITLVLKLSNKFVWTINGKNVTKAKDINLKAAMYTKNVPAEAIAEVSNGNTAIQLSLAYNGDFGFVGSISVPMNARFNGKTANLFYYNPETGKLEFVSFGSIENGQAELFFSHASDWVIIISDEPMAVIEDVAVGAGLSESSEPVDSTAETAAVIPVIAALIASSIALRRKFSK